MLGVLLTLSECLIHPNITRTGPTPVILSASESGVTKLMKGSSSEQSHLTAEGSAQRQWHDSGKYV